MQGSLGNPSSCGCTRRSVLVGAAAAGAAMTAAAAVNGVAANKALADDEAASEVSYEVIDADFLIVGAGFGALMAAYTAISKGKHVVMVDKGFYSRSGGCGFNWDVQLGWLPNKSGMVDALYMVPDGVNNLELAALAYEAYPSDEDGTIEDPLTMLNRGVCLSERNEDGSLKLWIDAPYYKSNNGFFPRPMYDTLAASSNFTIYDQTMVTDLIINDGRCVGVTSLHLPSGTYRVFRADAVVCSTGPGTWFYGWKTIAPYSIQSADNTGDVDMAAYRHGASIGESECCGFDFGTSYPDGFAHGWNLELDIDAVETQAFADKDGNPLFTDKEKCAEMGIDVERGKYDRPYFNKIVSEMMIEGAADENNCLTANINGVNLRKCMQRNVDYFKKIGLDLYETNVPIHDQVYERGGAPIVDNSLMSEDFEGLFLLRGAGAGAGIEGGSQVTVLHRNGYYGALKAIEYMEQAGPVAEIDWTPVEDEIRRLEGIRTKTDSDGIRPHVVRHAIQQTCGRSYGILRQKAALEESVAELERIRREDLPHMVVTSDSRTWNKEWKEAIENYNLLDAAELAIKASLMREETRGNYYYADFPEKSDDWGCMLLAKRNGEEIEWEKRVMPTHDFGVERSI